MERNPQRITGKDRKLVNKLDYNGINFTVSKKDYCRIEMQNKMCINVFCYDNKWTHPVHLSNQKFNDNMDLLLISNGFKTHYSLVSTILTDLFLIRLKIEIRNIFVSVVYSVSVAKKILIQHKKVV